MELKNDLANFNKKYTFLMGVDKRLLYHDVSLQRKKFKYPVEPMREAADDLISILRRYIPEIAVEINLDSEMPYYSYVRFCGFGEIKVEDAVAAIEEMYSSYHSRTGAYEGLAEALSIFADDGVLVEGNRIVSYLSKAILKYIYSCVDAQAFSERVSVSGNCIVIKSDSPVKTNLIDIVNYSLNNLKNPVKVMGYSAGYRLTENHSFNCGE